MDTDKFLIRKRAIFRKVKESKVLRGGVHQYAAQARPQIDAEIAQKGPFPDRNYLKGEPKMKSEELINVCQAVTHGNERYVRNLKRNAEGKIITCRDDGLEVEVDGRRETWRFEEELTVPQHAEGDS